ncbi:MAG TPA: PPOX class F420-dependent oxidoreductase [Dehalococcoidia bacterium]|nr:PPOX class F420-dependent oxidoreductase [Dehalococcoidia bacterium]
MPIPDEHREFLENHRLAVFGFARNDGPPSLTPVYYFIDGDEIVVSTTESRTKAKAVRRNPQVSICVLEENQPFPYLTVFGEARIETDGAAGVMARLAEVMSGNPLPDAARPALEQRAKDEGRVVMRVKPLQFVSTRTVGPKSA